MLKLILIFLIGLAIGIIATIVISRKKAVDELLVDISDTEDGPYMFLNLTHTPNAIMTQKYITLKVVIKNFLSQE